MDIDKQTGRTTRAIEGLLTEAMSGGRCVFITHTSRMADHAAVIACKVAKNAGAGGTYNRSRRRLSFGVGGGALYFVTVRSERDLDRLRGVTLDRAAVDHAVAQYAPAAISSAVLEWLQIATKQPEGAR